MQPHSKSTADIGRSPFLAGLGGPDVRHILAQATEQRVAIERWQSRYTALDQTIRPDVLAQIQCIVRKLA